MRYKGHLSKALVELFPEVSFERSKFKAARMFMFINIICNNALMIMFLDTYWVVTGNYRAYFTKFAKHKGFDPLSSTSWYKITHTDIKQWQVRSNQSIIIYWIHLILIIVFRKKWKRVMHDK